MELNRKRSACDEENSPPRKVRKNSDSLVADENCTDEEMDLTQLFVEDNTPDNALASSALKNEPKKTPSSYCSCFNCGEGHNLANCPYPTDQLTKTWGSLIFRLSKANSQCKSRLQRYVGRDDVEFVDDKTKLSRTSDKVREVLNLHPTALPPYIYAMRKMGYPKAWLNHAARLRQLTIYDTSGTSIPAVEMEEGEINMSELRSYDYNEFIEFPGFNVPADNCIDDYQRYGCPEFNPEQSLSAMIERLDEQASQQDKELTEQRPKYPENLTPEIAPKKMKQLLMEDTVRSPTNFNTMSGYRQLPSLENFSVGVSELVQFTEMPLRSTNMMKTTLQRLGKLKGKCLKMDDAKSNQ